MTANQTNMNFGARTLVNTLSQSWFGAFGVGAYVGVLCTLLYPGMKMLIRPARVSRDDHRGKICRELGLCLLGLWSIHYVTYWPDWFLHGSVILPLQLLFLGVSAGRLEAQRVVFLWAATAVIVANNVLQVQYIRQQLLP
jgi:hypothetical protein